jgi:alpha-beta hydrolase superfamily lysophospholipase
MISDQANGSGEYSGSWISMDDCVQLYLRHWDVRDTRNVPQAARAALHIIHGMGEHSLRYGPLARHLRAAGIEVWAADQRGHGETAGNRDNLPGGGGLLGHCADGDGFARVAADIEFLNRHIQKERPGLPLFLLGHSWGSFIAQHYIENFEGRSGARARAGGGEGVFLAGCILSGTRGPGGGAKVALGAPAMTLLALIKGERRPSLLAKALADGPYNRPFRPNRTPVDWLSRDEREVDAYVADPLCGQLCSVGFYRDLAKALRRIYRGEELEKIRKELPVYIFSGSADPVGDMGERPTALAAALRRRGLRDLETVLYPDARHEPLNETNREEVTGSLLSWLLRHIPSPS